MEKLSFKVSKEDSQKRLDVFLALKVEDKSRNFIRNLIKKGFVILNNKSTTKSAYVLREGDFIEIIQNTETSRKNKELKSQKELKNIRIIYEDDYLMVVDKPKGILTHKIKSNEEEKSLVDFLIESGKKLSNGESPLRQGIVHRLDKDTSGLLIVAKNNKTHFLLKELIQKREIKRYYIALVHGLFNKKRGIVNLPIAPSKKIFSKKVISFEGKSSITNFEVIKSINKKYSLLRIQLETGRTHQIRVHMAYIGHPVAGDKVYGIKKKEALNSQFLHAYRLEFEHPVTGKILHFFSPLPNILIATLKEIVKNE